MEVVVACFNVLFSLSLRRLKKNMRPFIVAAIRVCIRTRYILDTKHG